MTQRRYDIDALRNLAVLALLLFHTARLWDRQSWHIKEAETFLWADAIVRLMNPWHMPLLFLLAGASMAFGLGKRSGAQFVKERFLRLGLPFLVGIFATVLPQVYLERIAQGMANRQSPVDFQGSLLDFLPRFFDCCYPQANFSWHHLWFVFYLLVFSLAALPVIRWAERNGRATRLTAWLQAAPWRLFLPGLLLLGIELVLRPRFPSTNDFATDWANNAHYFALLLLGWLVFVDARMDAAIAAIRRAALIGALLFCAAWAWAVLGEVRSGLPMRLAIRTGFEWCALLALLGYGRVFLSARVPYLTAFTRHAYPFYIFHQMVIILLGFWLVGWAAAPLLKYAVIVVASGALSYALCRLIDTNPVTRVAFGLTPR